MRGRAGLGAGVSGMREAGRAHGPDKEAPPLGRLSSAGGLRGGAS